MALGLVAPASTTAVGEAPIACGTVLTTDVRLTTDLLDCPGSGLVVGASGDHHRPRRAHHRRHRIRRRHRQRRRSRRRSHHPWHPPPVLFGIELFETSGARVDRVAAESNIGGVIISRSADVELDQMIATGSVGNGIDVTLSERVTVRRSTATDNGLAGIVDRFSQDDRYEQNTATGTPRRAWC